MEKVNFNCTAEEAEIIEKIAERACEKFDITDKVSLISNVTATHCNGNRLRLQEFLDSDDLDFVHDIGGIMGHIDQNTGKLTDCFLPLFSE